MNEESDMTTLKTAYDILNTNYDLLKKAYDGVLDKVVSIDNKNATLKETIVKLTLKNEELQEALNE